MQSRDPGCCIGSRLCVAPHGSAAAAPGTRIRIKAANGLPQRKSPTFRRGLL